jgi:putative tryptophan/tyrosine transport system substrate-binding protein
MFAKTKHIFYLISAALLAVQILYLVPAKAGDSSRQKTVIVLKYATHPALDELEQNFIGSLKQRRPKTDVVVFNANGNPVSAKQLAESATIRKPDLIVSLATPATQAVANTQSNIPLLYAAVADPVGANVVSNRTTGIQNAGPALILSGLQKIKLMFPDAKTVGTLYNPGEQNSRYAQEILEKQCQELGLKLIQRAVSNPTQLQETVEQLRKQVDVLYSTNDNLMNAGAFTVGATAKQLKLPFFIGELSAVSKGALAGVGVEYASMGQRLGELAVKILNGSPADPLPPREGPPESKFWLNAAVARDLGINLKSDISAVADKVLP